MKDSRGWKDTPEESRDGIRVYTNFIYLSEFYKEGVSENFGRAYAVARAADDDTLIGFDENSGPDQVSELVRVLGDKKVGFSLYLEGPGGPTGENGRFQADELKRIAERAQKFCAKPITDPRSRFAQDGVLSARLEDYEGYTDSELDRLPWMKEWNTTGWPRYFREECLPKLRGEKQPYFEGLTFEAVELDNLYRHLEASDKSYKQFLSDFEQWVRSGSNLNLRLVLKNLNFDEEKLKDTLAYAKSHGNSLFAGYHVAEASGWSKEGRLESIGVKTVYSSDTYDYLATNIPGLESQLKNRTALAELESAVASGGSDLPSPDG